MSTTRQPKPRRPLSDERRIADSRAASKPVTIVIEESASIKFLYDDKLAALLDEGTAMVERASHVEPEQTDEGVCWCADMAPIGGPKLSGFPTRAAALAAEVDWLNANYL